MSRVIGARRDERIAIVCRDCGSTEVSRDAWADWDANKQEWVLGAVFDLGWCHACDCESKLGEWTLVG